MKEFNFSSLPEELQLLIQELVEAHGLFKTINWGIEGKEYIEFKVQTLADPEWGNGHVPLAVYLVKHGANKGETVKIVGI